VAKAGEDKTGDTTLKRLEKSQFSTLESDDEIALTEFNAVRTGDCVNALGIEPEVIKRSEDVARGRIRGGESGAATQKKKQQSGPRTHALSVVTFGMWGQGGGKSRSLPL